jgi:hypothetical protein
MSRSAVHVWKVFPRMVLVGTRSRLIRVRTSEGHVRCSASDGRWTPARPASPVRNGLCGHAAPDAPERVCDQRRCTGCDHQTSCRGSRGSASLPSDRRRLVESSNPPASSPKRCLFDREAAKNGSKKELTKRPPFLVKSLLCGSSEKTVNGGWSDGRTLEPF